MSPMILVISEVFGGIRVVKLLAAMFMQYLWQHGVLEDGIVEALYATYLNI